MAVTPSGRPTCRAHGTADRDRSTPTTAAVRGPAGYWAARHAHPTTSRTAGRQRATRRYALPWVRSPHRGQALM